MKEYKKIPGGLTAAQGFLAAGVYAGLKKAKKDLALIVSTVPASAAGVFTTNKVKAAPLLVNMEQLQQNTARAVIINSGNANACTGQQGLANARKMAELTAAALNCNPTEILVASTGVIGVQLPMDLIAEGIGLAARELTPAGGPLAAEAIMTTDTFPKEISVEFTVHGRTAVLGGAAKGSGMIHPNMATMLGFLTTDLAISKELLQEALSEVVKRTFNMITVDGDTSTNDMVLVLANGQAGNELLQSKEDSGYAKFYEALTYVCTYLSREIARDGEGATKLLTVEVLNAPTEKDAQLAARAVCSSNLVKTALFGEDANWGRIICAVGYSGAEFDPAQVDIFIKSAAGQEQVAVDGAGLEFSEENAKAVLSEQEVTFVVDLKTGKEKATAWSCDFSYDYVKINGSYRT